MAATKFIRSDDFRTPIGRLSYAQFLFKPREAKQAGRAPKYECTLIFPKADLSAKTCTHLDGRKVSFEDIVAGVLTEKYGPAGIEKARNGLIALPWRAGDGKEARNKETGEIHAGLGPDVFFIRVKSGAERPPTVFPTTTSTAVPATQAEVYSGCYGFGVLNAFWYPSQDGGSEGVAIGINSFFKKSDGEKLGSSGGSDASAWAETVENTGGAPAETKTGAGAGGLFGAMG